MFIRISYGNVNKHVNVARGHFSHGKATNSERPRKSLFNHFRVTFYFGMSVVLGGQQLHKTSSVQ